MPHALTGALAWPGHERVPRSKVSCPGRVQRAPLRERNETRDPAQDARSAILFSSTCRRMAPGSRLGVRARANVCHTHSRGRSLGRDTRAVWVRRPSATARSSGDLTAGLGGLRPAAFVLGRARARLQPFSPVRQRGPEVCDVREGGRRGRVGRTRGALPGPDRAAPVMARPRVGTRVRRRLVRTRRVHLPRVDVRRVRVRRVPCASLHDRGDSRPAPRHPPLCVPRRSLHRGDGRRLFKIAHSN